VQLTITFPGVVTSTNGDRVDSNAASWKLKPGVVSTMNRARPVTTDPNTRSFTGAGIWLGVAALAAAGVVGVLAWLSRDRSERLTAERDQTLS